MKKKIICTLICVWLRLFLSDGENPAKYREGGQQIKDKKSQFLMAGCPTVQNCGDSKKVEKRQSQI